MRPPLRTRAKSLRKEPTEAEHIMWFELRNRRLGGHKFTRQVPIGPYIVDFVCRQQKLIVELDGGQHSASKYDEVRTNHLNEFGYGVVRFWNNQVLDHRDAVFETMTKILEGGADNTGLGVRYSPPRPAIGSDVLSR